jgi:hypothetical protein
MSVFWLSVLANFLGSLVAGAVLASIAYLLITRELEIIRPREERIAEQLMVCDLLIGELEKGQRFAQKYLIGGPHVERLEMHAWDALKGSQPLRFLPISCVRPVLKAYSDLYVLEHFFLSLEDAQMKEWTSGEATARSGAALLGKNISKGVALRLDRAQISCAEAATALRAERQRLQLHQKTKKGLQD